MLYRVIDDNGTKKREALTGIGYGMPLGATVVLADTAQIPDGYLLYDGSTFDETVYPALYAYLGTNVLPEVFDHSKPSAYREQTVTYTAATAQTAPTDMDVYATMSSVSAVSQIVYVNGAEIMRVNAPLTGQACTATASFSLKKGDIWYITRGSTSVGAPTAACKAYEQHKAIKATPAGSGDISDVVATYKNVLKGLVDGTTSYDDFKANVEAL